MICKNVVHTFRVFIYYYVYTFTCSVNKYYSFNAVLNT